MKKKIKAVLLDDDPTFLIYIKNQLLKFSDNLSVKYVDNFEAGLNDFLLNKYDVFIIDYYLDKKHTALEFVKMVRDKKIMTPIFVFTSDRKEAEIDIACIKNGANGFFDKNKLNYKNLYEIIKYSVLLTDVNNKLTSVGRLF